MDNSEYKKRIYKILGKNEFFVKKKFSQNFLLDENIISNIIKSAKIDKNTSVIEVGPGLGALTKDLLKSAKEVMAYEIDEDLIPILKDLFSDYENLNIIHKDILKVDIDRDIEAAFNKPSRIVLVSNLPYHITTPIIMKILEESALIESMVLMMQYEVAKRITSQPNTKDYNALSIIIQHQSDSKYLFKVPKTVFNPQPKVDSAVIKIDRYHDLIGKNQDFNGFYKFLHAAFKQRRKTFVNNIFSSYISVDKESFMNLLDKHHIDRQIRAEALSLKEFIELYDDFINIFDEVE